MSSYRKTPLVVLSKGVAGFGLVFSFFLLTGCAVERYFLEYRVNVQQGNVVEQKNIVQLKPGMTRDQVRYVLGTPLLQDPFHANRWDYVYRYEDGATGDITMRNIFAYFNAAGQLERVGGDVAPGKPVGVQITGDVNADASAAADLAAAVRSNEPQVIIWVASPRMPRVRLKTPNRQATPGGGALSIYSSK